MNSRRSLTVMFVFGVVLAGLLTAGAPKALGGPAVLQITSTGQFCQNGGACVFDNEANPLTGTSLSIFDNQGGSVTLDNPLLLIIGIPNGTIGQSLPTVTSGNGSLGGADYYHGDWATTGADLGFAPSLFNSSSTQDVYAFLGMAQGNTSESFTNWSGADTSAAVGLSSVSDYAIAVYELNAALASKGNVTVDFSSALPLGSVVSAYGCSKASIGDGLCNSSENPYTTSWTEAGVDAPQSASESSAITLVGEVLLVFIGAAVYSRRRARV